jgi:hypothetical protein
MTTNKKNIFIFDWDDTICPTSWLTSKNYIMTNTINSFIQVNLDDHYKLDSHAQKISILLEKCLHIGYVIIITNADTNWINMCISKFIPNLQDIMTRIRCYSARSLYQSTFIPHYWKVATFSYTLRDYMDDKYKTSVISFGDSEYEKNANKLFCMNYKNCYSKVIKYIESPTIEELGKQNDLVCNYIEHICSYDGDIDNVINKQFIKS